MNHMFSDCRSLEELDLSSFTFKEYDLVTYDEFLYGAHNLKKLTVSKDIIIFFGKLSVYNKFLGWNINMYDYDMDLDINIK